VSRWVAVTTGVRGTVGPKGSTGKGKNHHYSSSVSSVLPAPGFRLRINARRGSRGQRWSQLPRRSTLLRPKHFTVFRERRNKSICLCASHHLLQIATNIGGSLIPHCAILLQRIANDLLQTCRNLWNVGRSLGVSFKSEANMIAELLPEKAGRPVAISYMTRPKEKWSVRTSSFSPRACSGDM